MIRRFPSFLASAAGAALLAACGGGSTVAPPPPPPPATPVAAVTVSPATASLNVAQTQALTATTKDANGNALSGRSVTWSTNAASVASVGNDGLVTAAGPGQATITATSEGKTGTATISVSDGGSVTQTGGTVNAAGGSVKISVPAGAVNSSVQVTVTASTNQPALPEGINGVGGTSFTFGPEGTTFAQPVTVTVKYDPTKAPAWAIPSDFALYHYNGTDWEVLPGQVVDATAHTVTATTTSFSPFTIGTRLPPAVLTPSPGSVNFIQRSVMFTASIPGHQTSQLQFTWTTTGFNGAISPLSGGDALYTMTQAQLPPGDLDQVQVIVHGNIDPTLPNVVVSLASAVATVNADLKYSFEVNPDESEPDFGQTQKLRAVVRQSDGSIYTGTSQLPVLMVWTSSDLHGKFDIANPNHKTDVDNGTYTAKTEQQSAATPPRIDEVSVDFYIGYLKSYTTPITQFGQTINRIDSTVARFDRKDGNANAFLEVAPKTLLGSFKTRRIPTTGGACVTADALVPKVTGATSYDLTITGIIMSSLGPTIHKTFTGPTHTNSIMDIYDGGIYYGVPLDGGCGSSSNANFREGLYAQQYGGAAFKVKTTP